MATPKFDRILQEFSRRIGDRLTSAFTPGVGAYPNGTLLDSTDAIAYVNKALNEYHGRVWNSVGGDRYAFIRLFPELLFEPSVGLTFPFTIASPYLDFFTLYDGYISGYPCRIETEDKLVLLNTGKYPRHGPSATKPIMISVANKVYLFAGATTTGYIIYIKLPISPTTGGFLAQNGAATEDSPFHYIHNSKIAALAEELYWNEKEPKP